MSVISLLEPLQHAARLAGARIMEIREQGASFTVKGDGSPVTLADQAAEEIILAALKDVAPEIPVISEENAESHALSAPDRFFLVDPLDGTKEFLRGGEDCAFTVNIALVEHNEPILGIVYAPAQERMFVGEKSSGAMEWKAGKRRAIAVRTQPDQGAIAVASRSHLDEQTERWLAENKVAGTISTGSSLKFCLVACGEADVYPRFGTTMEWDTAAGHAILTAAGGNVRRPDGSLFVYGKPDYRNGPFIARGEVLESV